MSNRSAARLFLLLGALGLTFAVNLRAQSQNIACSDKTITATGRTLIAGNGASTSAPSALSYAAARVTYYTTGSPSALSIQIEDGNQAIATQTPIVRISATTNTTGADLGFIPISARNLWANLTILTGGTSPTVVVTTCLSTQAVARANGGTINPKYENLVRKCDQFPGTDAGQKINACILDVETAGGGVADARGIVGSQIYSTTIDLCQQTAGNANLTLLLGRVSLAYFPLINGVGDAFNCTTPNDGFSNCTQGACGRFVEVIGIGRWASIASVFPGRTARSIFHQHYSTTIKFEDLTPYADGSLVGQATYLIFNDQSLETIMYNVEGAANTTSLVAGQYANYELGTGFNYASNVVLQGGQNAIRVEPSTLAIPPTIKAKMSYITGSFTDGDTNHNLRYDGLTLYSAFEACFYADATAAADRIQDISISHYLFTLCGRSASGADVESGAYIKGSTGRQVVNFSLFQGALLQNFQHGLVLDGNVSRCSVKGSRAAENGNASGTAHQLYLMNGSVSGAPSDCNIEMSLDATGLGTNDAFSDCSGCTHNQLNLSVANYGWTMASVSDHWTISTLNGFFGSDIGIGRSNNATAPISTGGVDTPVQSMVIPPGWFNINNRTVTVKAMGIAAPGTAVTPTVIFKLKLCTVAGCATGTARTLLSWVATAATTAGAINTFGIDASLGTIDTGASGTIIAHGERLYQLGSSTTDQIVTNYRATDVNTAKSSAIDLTGTTFLELHANYSARDSGSGVQVNTMSAIPTF